MNSSCAPKCCFSCVEPSGTLYEGPMRHDFKTEPFLISAPSQIMQFSITTLKGFCNYNYFPLGNNRNSPFVNSNVRHDDRIADPGLGIHRTVRPDN